MPTPTEELGSALQRLAPEFGVQLNHAQLERFGQYYELVLKWNPRLHLIAPCPAEEFASRHLLESTVMLRYLPRGARIIDVGSGAGLPIIPCLIMRDDLRATLVESSQKKSVFLREALRPLAASSCLQVTRFEEMQAPAADFVSCRALDRFQELVPTLIDWAPAGSTLLFFGGPGLVRTIEGLALETRAELIPRSEQRFLIRTRKNQ